MAAGTLIRRVMLQIQSDDGDTEEKLDRIKASADELAEKHPELKVRINSAAASAQVAVIRKELQEVAKPVDVPVRPKVDKSALAQVRTAGAQSGNSFGQGFSLTSPQVIIPAVAAALAALPALMAAGGATAGIALGAALLIGTSKVKGPLYDQFHSLTQGLLGEIRTAALPLVKPLGDAFKQVGQWAAALKPELTQVFASVGPSVMPLAKGLEGVVSGVLPGFISLMKAARPAVTAVSGVLSQFSRSIGSMLAGMGPAVRNSSTFLSGLGGVASSLLPVIGQLANTLSALLAPVMKTLGGTVAPLLSRAVTGLLKSVGPLIPGIAGLASQLLKLAASAITPLIGPATKIVSVLATGMAPVLPPLTKALAQLGQMIGGEVAQQAQVLIPPMLRLISAGLQLYTQVAVPLIPPLAQLAGVLIQVGVAGIEPLIGPLASLMDGMARAAGAVSGSLVPALQTLVGWLSTVANAASKAIGFVEGLLGIHGGGGGVSSSASVGGLPGASEAFVGGLGGPADPSPVMPVMPTYSAAGAGAGWSSGLDNADVSGAKSKARARNTAALAAQKAAATALGRAITAGIGSGVKESVPTAEAEARKLAERVHSALMAGQITTAQANTLVAGIDNQLQSRGQRAVNEANKLGTQLNNSLARSIAASSSTDKVKSAVTKLLSDVTAAWQSGMISLQRDQSLTKWLDAESASLQKLEKERTAVQAKITAAKSYAASTASSAEGAYAFSDFASGNGPGNGPKSAGQIITSLHGDLIQVKQFTANIKKLAKDGLNKGYLQQLIAMGPVQGGPLAQELAGTALSDIKSINKYEYELNQSSGQLGKLAANTMYDAGAKGFLSGLEKQQSQINAVFAKATKNMVTQLRKELGIKNGKQTMELKITGGNAAFREFLKKSIRVTGGNVSVVGA